MSKKAAPSSARRRDTRPSEDGRAALGYTKPRTYEELRAVLTSGTPHFPKRLRQVAIFLWQHPDDVALGTISEVARQVGVQPSTLVRFAKIFGYAGFSDFQAIFKDHIKGARPGNLARGKSRNNANLHFIQGMAGASQASLGRINDGFDLAAFERMVAIIARADLVYVIGSKRAFPVTTYVSLSLSQQGIKNVLVDNVGSTAFDQVGCVGPRDAVLAVSFSPYNSITPELVAAAREHRAKVVSITDSAFSPLIGLSDAWVEVIESDFAGFRSLAATLVVGMALAHGVMARRTPRS